MFSKQHQTPAFSSNFSHSLHSLIEFVPFFVLYDTYVDRWVTSTKNPRGSRGGSKYRWLCWDHQRDQWSKSTTIATSAAPWTTSTWQWPFYGRCAEGITAWGGFFGPWIPVCVKSLTTLTSEKNGETSFQRMLKSRWDAVSDEDLSFFWGPKHQHLSCCTNSPSCCFSDDIFESWSQVISDQLTVIIV